MRAATELARDGHRVVLLEREEQLGGQLLLARRVPGRESIDLLLSDLARDLAAAGVDVRLGVHATATTIRAEAPDEVVVATGAAAVDLSTLLAASQASGRRVVVVDGDGTSYASGVVLTLLGAGLAVEVVTAFETLFPHVGSGYDRPLLLETLGSWPFTRHVQHVVEDHEGGTVTARDTLTGSRVVLAADAVVTLDPREPVLPEGLPDTAHVIGDALAPRGIDAAIFEAVELAYATARTR
jgi:hypothetical protein